MIARARTGILRLAGGSLAARAWAKSRCKAWGVEVRKVEGAVELRRGEQAIRLDPKHIFFVSEVCQGFDSFARGLPARERDGMCVIDFSARPEVFNMFRACMARGVALEHRRTEIWLRKGDRAMILSWRHGVYAAEMAEKFELYFSPLVPEMRDGFQVLDYSRPGIVQTYRQSGLQFEMASFPEEEEAIEEYFKWYRPKVGDLVFDVGAHCGVSTYALSKLVGAEGKVISFEPDPINYGILLRNVERHELTNVIAVNAAISGTAGKLAFNSEGTIGSGLVSLLDRDSAGSIVTVDAITLADAFARWGVPAFCKIDIEGAEVDVIGSSAELLRRHRTNFALDTNHPKGDGRMTDGDIEGMFRSYGYETESEANPLLTTWARPASTKRFAS